MKVSLQIVVLITHYASAQVTISKFVPLNEQMYAVTSPVPRTWLEMRAQCNAEHPGYFIFMKIKMLPPKVEALCPNGTLVPVPIVQHDDGYVWDNVGDLQYQEISDDDWDTLKLDYINENGSYGAFVWPNTTLQMVGDEALFTCAICGMSQRLNVVTKGVFPPHDNSMFSYDIELVSNDRIYDVDVVANGSDIANHLLDDLAEAFNISIKDLRWHRATLNEDHKAEVHVYYNRGGENADWFYYDRWYDKYVEHKTVDNFKLSMIKLNTECPSGKKNLPNVKREAYLTGAVDVIMVDGSMESKKCMIGLPKVQLLKTRECYWNAVDETALWSQWNTWCPVWDPTDEGPGLILTGIRSLKGQEYKNALKNIDVMVVYALEFQLIGWDEKYPLRFLVFLANTLMQLHVSPFPSVFDMLSYKIPDSLAKMLMVVKLHKNIEKNIYRNSLANILVAESDSINTAVGLALALSEDVQNPEVEIEMLNHTSTTLPLDEFHIAVTVSDSIAFSAQRLAIGIYCAHRDPPNQTRKYYDYSIDSWMAIVQVTFRRHNAYNGSLDLDFVDIAFRSEFYSPSLRGKCAERNITTDDWFGDNCRILRSMRDNMLVCRCKNLRQLGTITTNLYLIYGFDASLSTYLANNLTLVIVMVIVGFMSVLGFLSVVLTAVRFPEWRADQGHKIFLQMTSALSVNLVLGFVNNFISVDTKSVACVAIGALRHYSFLAMFTWMMVLSGLQVKRLTTISGSKGTTHLILKVSTIAWGFPLIPIIVLLSWDTGFYKSEVSNRGYCYPEAKAFQATVQAPAGVILAANLVIFVIILNHLYGWVKCNKDVVIRKHNVQGDRAEQLRKLCNSIFVFFLFGFTWTFHFLSEEGIINSEFLFEFLFLITASFHLFMLSLFFIVLDKKTRELWIKILPCK